MYRYLSLLGNRQFLLEFFDLLLVISDFFEVLLGDLLVFVFLVGVLDDFLFIGAALILLF